MPEIQTSSFSLTGIRVDALKLGDLLAIVRRARNLKGKALILNHNLHSLYLYIKLRDFRDLYAKASYIYVDGMPVVWLSRFAGLPFRNEHRTTLLDSLDAVLENSSRLGWRIFYLGSTAPVLSTGLAILRGRHPDLILEGRNGYIAKDGDENDQVLAQINRFKPDLLFVGMGMPVQERWLLENLPRIEAHCILTCGATLDYVVGAAYTPPAWTGRLGLYGVFRFFSDPVRLGSRYLLEPFVLLRHLLVPILKQRFANAEVAWTFPEEGECRR